MTFDDVRHIALAWPEVELPKKTVKDYDARGSLGGLAKA